MKSSRSAVLRFLFVVSRLIKHLGGFLLFSILRRLGLAPRGRGVLSDMPPQKRIRLFLQEVGGALIKVGQILAMRVDFLPEAYVQELLKLLDEVPPFSSAEARRIIEEELCGEIEDLFKAFDNDPLAAASFGQVHAATLRGGEKVVVKVRRPGVPEVITADLKLFSLITFLVDSTGLTRRTPIRPIYEEFSEWTKEELDYRIEGSHVQEIYEKAAGSKTERIPAVHWSHTTARVLTLERLHGLWVKEIMHGLQNDRAATLKKLAERNTSLTEISQNLLRNTLRQIFVYGVYHADPHAGNLLVMRDGVIGYVDFGITGRIGEQSKESQVRIHVGLESGDFDKFFAALVDTLSPPHDADLSGFERQMRQSYITWLNSQYMGRGNTRDKSFARLMLKINNAAQTSGLAFKSMEVRIFRALATVDAVLLEFAPTLDVRSEFRHFFGTYKAIKFVKDDIPGLLHKLPTLLEMMTERLERTVVHHTARVSRARRALALLSGLLGVALFVAGLAAAVSPAVARVILAGAGLGRVWSVVLLLLAAAFCGWLAHLLKMRSVIHYSTVEQNRNVFRRTDRED